jgi:hypothetical protein
MATAKDIVIKQIDSKTANDIVRKLHYSGKVVSNSQIHFGVFINNVLEGAMQFGPSLDKRKIQGLVSGTLWHEFIELNRMAFSEALPRNSESRAIAIVMRLLKKNAPQLKWVVSFADATQCGDGTIYRASGFVLTGIKENGQILDWDGQLIAKKTLDNLNYPRPNGKYYSRVLLETGQAHKILGFQLRYIYFLDPSYRARLTVPEIPFSEIEKRGAKMYKGNPGGRGETDNALQSNDETGGASPTRPLLETA